jgi:hypothetical protein
VARRAPLFKVSHHLRAQGEARPVGVDLLHLEPGDLLHQELEARHLEQVDHRHRVDHLEDRRPRFSRWRKNFSSSRC